MDKNIYKGYLPKESDFSYSCASWAKNHRGWSKMKKLNKRLAKQRLKQYLRKTFNKEEQNG